MLGVVSTHEPIRGEFAQAVKQMLADGKNARGNTGEKPTKWVVSREF